MPSSGANTPVLPIFTSAARWRARAASSRAAAVWPAGLVLRCQLRAVEALLAQLAGAFGIALRLARARLQFGNRRLRLGQFAGDGIAGDARQQLPFFTDPRRQRHLGNPVAGDLGADHRLLPGNDVTVGHQHLRPFFTRRNGDGHGERRALGRAIRRGICGRLAALPPDRTRATTTAPAASAMARGRRAESNCRWSWKEIGGWNAGQSTTRTGANDTGSRRTGMFQFVTTTARTREAGNRPKSGRRILQSWSDGSRMQLQTTISNAAQTPMR